MFCSSLEPDQQNVHGICFAEDTFRNGFTTVTVLIVKYQENHTGNWNWFSGRECESKLQVSKI